MPDEAKRDTLPGAAVDTAVRELASMAVIALVSFALLHHDAVYRLYRRLSERRVTPEQAYANRAVAELRRDISAYEHRGGA
jgi:hypothetical protein